MCVSVHGGGSAIPACIAGGIPACLAAGLLGGCYTSMHCRWYPSMPCSRSPRGGACSNRCLLVGGGGACSGGVCSQGGSAPRACLFLGGVRRPPLKQTAAVADGTHPTGMHSCLVIFQEIKAWKSWDYKAKDGSTQVAGFVRQFENLTFLTVKVSTDIYAQRNISTSKLQTKIIVKT